jgi:hypothetical protein
MPPTVRTVRMPWLLRVSAETACASFHKAPPRKRLARVCEMRTRPLMRRAARLTVVVPNAFAEAACAVLHKALPRKRLAQLRTTSLWTHCHAACRAA